MTTESLQLSFPSLLKQKFICRLFRIKLKVKLFGFERTFFRRHKFTQVDNFEILPQLKFFIERTKSSSEDTSQVNNFGELKKLENNHYFLFF